MKNLQLLSFELTNRCNLSHVHPWCPSNRPERYSDSNAVGMTDGCIIDFVCACMRYGFHGRVAFHYYNEPTLDMNRCVWLANACKAMGIGNVLWTNGTCRNIPENTFDDVFATAYDTMPGGVTRKIPYQPDGRIDVYETEPKRDDCPACYRPSVIEIPINFYGDVRMCCSDWAGTVKIGNITTDEHDKVIWNWREACYGALDGAFDVCKRCHNIRLSPALVDKDYKL